MANLAFGPLAHRPLADVPASNGSIGWLQSWNTPVRRKASVAIAAATFGAFVPVPSGIGWFEPLSTPQAHARQIQPQFQPPIVPQSTGWIPGFADKPQSKRLPVSDAQPWFDVETEPSINLDWFSWLSEPPRYKARIVSFQFLIASDFTPYNPIPNDPYVKSDWRKKRKKKPYDIVDLQIKERDDLRKDIALAIYGPPVEYKFTVPTHVIPPPVNPGNLPQIMLAVQQQKIAQAKAREDAEDEAEIEDILKEL